MAEINRESQHQLWTELVEKNCSVAGLRNPPVTRYLVALLEDFSRTERLYRVRLRGRTLSTVPDLLAFSASWSALPAQERALQQYIGDFSLFMTGLFRANIEARGRGGTVPAYISAGKACYRAVSQWRQEGGRRSVEDLAVSAQPEVFAWLAEEFERCVHGLNLVRSEVESFQEPLYRELEQEVRRMVDEA